MASYPAQQLQEEFLNAIRKSQETVVVTVRTWAETVQSVTPKVPSVKVPFADRLPSPQDAVTSAYDFAEQLLAGQRQFTQELLTATAPLLPGSGSSAQE